MFPDQQLCLVVTVLMVEHQMLETDSKIVLLHHLQETFLHIDNGRLIIELHGTIDSANSFDTARELDMNRNDVVVAGTWNCPHVSQVNDNLMSSSCWCTSCHSVGSDEQPCKESFCGLGSVQQTKPKSVVNDSLMWLISDL